MGVKANGAACAALTACPVSDRSGKRREATGKTTGRRRGVRRRSDGRSNLDLDFEAPTAPMGSEQNSKIDAGDGKVADCDGSHASHRQLLISPVLDLINHRIAPFLSVTLSSVQKPRQNCLFKGRAAAESSRTSPTICLAQASPCTRFEDIDTNGDGFLTRDELLDYCTKKNLPLKYVDQLYSAFGETNGGRGVSRSAFCRYAAKREASVFEEFKKLDPSGTGAGRVSAEDLKRYLDNNGLSFLRPIGGGGCPTTRCTGSKLECKASCKGIERCREGAVNEAPLTRVRVPRHCSLLHAEDLLHHVSTRKDKTIGYAEFREFTCLVPLNACVWTYWADATRNANACMDAGTSVTCVPLDVQLPCPVVAAARQWRRLTAARSTLAQIGSNITPQGSPVGHLVAGSVAGALSRTITAPLETVRIRLATGQIPVELTSRHMGGAVGGWSTTGSARVVGMMRHIAKNEGIRGLWSGNIATVMRTAPQKGIDFYAYEVYKGLLRDLSNNDGDVTSAQAICAGAAAGATSTLLLYPLELVRTRLVTGMEKGHSGVRGVISALRGISHREGVRALYRGLGPTLLGIVPEAGITYGSFDLLKRRALKSKRLRVARRRARSESATAEEAADIELQAWECVICGIAAALLGQTASYPLETIGRRRALGHVASAAQAAPRSALARVASLYSGWGTASVRVVPMALLSFGTYEAVRAAMQ